jgi:lysophospholipase L1-like esterase
VCGRQYFHIPEREKTYAPDLTFISLGINDAGLSTPAATFSTNMQAIIAAAQVSGDVVLMSIPPSQDLTRITYEPLYENQLFILHNTLGLPFIDIFRRFGSSYNAPFMAADGLRPRVLGLGCRD